MSLIGLFRDWVVDPIGMLFLLSIVLLTLLWLRRCSVGLLVGTTVWLAAVFFVSAPRWINPILVYYEDQYQAQPDCLADRPIVLLGGGVDSRVQRPEQSQYMSHSTFVRATAAAKLASVFPDSPVLVAGGALRSVSEAAVIGGFLRAQGVVENRIYEEGESSNTFENAAYVRALIDQHEFNEHINLVTSALHMKRAKATFEKQGFQVCAVAVDRHGIKNVPNYAWWPQITALQKFDLLMHEQLALVLYKVKGRL